MSERWRWRRPHMAAMLLSLALAGCGQKTPLAPTPSPTATPPPTSTSEPTSTPLPAMSAYLHPTGVYSLTLPEGWTVEDDTGRDTISTLFTAPDPAKAQVHIYIVSVVGEAQPDIDSAAEEYLARFWRDTPFADATHDRRPDGSLGLTASVPMANGVPGELQAVFERHGPFFSVFEFTVAQDQSEAQLPVLAAVSGSYAVNPDAEFGPGQIKGEITGDQLPASGVLLWQAPGGGAVLTGQVRNLSPEPLEFVQVAATLRDGAGNVLAVENAYVLGDVVPVDDFASFAVHFSGVDYLAVKTFEMKAVGDRARFLIGAWYGSESHLRVEDKRVAINPDGSVNITATIRNVGGQTAETVRAIITLFDQAGKVVAAGFDYADPERLAPGETAEVEHTISDLGGAPDTFTLRAEGKVVAP